MCRPVPCERCHKTTWAGCGAHVEKVMSRVEPSARCTCKEKEREPRPSLLASLVGRLAGR